MDETPESASEPGEQRGGDAPRPTRSRGRGRPRRWWEQPWLWLGVVVVIVAAAFGISVAVNTDPDDITPTGDTAAFCASMAKYRDARDASDANPNSVEKVTGLRTALVAVQQVSPSEIRPTSDELVGALDQVIQVQQDNQTNGTSLDASAAADAKLSSIENGVQRATLRFANYTRRACGIDLDATPPAATVPPGSPDTSVVTPVPSDRATLVTPG
jgi:hypothetical protein